MQQVINQKFTEEGLVNAMQAFPRVRKVYEATTTVEGDSSQEIRQHIMAYATNPAADTLRLVPEALQLYIQKVVEESYKVTDSDIKELQNSGYSEDFVFEITVTASLGAGLHRFRAGIDALSK